MQNNLYKEVKISTLMKSKKKFLLHLIISNLKEGKSPAQIADENDISKQNLNYYLRQLKKEGVIEKESYGVWKVLKEVKKSTKARITHKQIRGHGFNWKVRFKYEIDWKRRLERFKVPHETLGVRGNTPRIILNNKKIWLTKKGLVVYEPKSFFSDSSHTSKGQAVWELDKTIKRLGRLLEIDLEGYEFTTSREHYGQIKNELAKQYNDKGEKLYIRDDKGNWMWIDDSHALNELETNEPKVSKQVQDWYNDWKKNNFDLTATDIKTAFMKLSKEIEDLKSKPQLSMDIPNYIG